MTQQRNPFNKLIFALMLLLILLIANCLRVQPTAAQQADRASAASTFIVNSTNNVTDGSCNVLHCSLKEAINAANNSDDHSFIRFNFATPVTLSPDFLPVVETKVTIDGITSTNSTCPSAAAAGNLSITIDGSNASDDGFVFNSGYNEVESLNDIDATIAEGSALYGLNIVNFANGPAVTDFAGDIAIYCNHIGITNGGVAAPNRVGILLANNFMLAPASDSRYENEIVVSSGPAQTTIGVGSGDFDGRNVISGNANFGIEIYTAQNTVHGNYIGTNLAGTAAVGNGSHGILVLEDADNTVIGGDGGGATNIVSGNVGAGMRLWSDGNSVLGNRIGVNKAENAALPNGGSGIVVFGNDNSIGGVSVGSANIISGNGFRGIELQSSSVNQFAEGGTEFQADGTHIGRNFIGTNTAGLLALPNGLSGVELFGATSTLIGVSSSEAPTIAFNRLYGVGIQNNLSEPVYAASGNQLRFGRIFSNSSQGIMLGDGLIGSAPNDSGDGDSGPNGLQNYPELTQVLSTGLLLGRLDSVRGQAYTIDVYESTSCDASGYGEGQDWLASFTMTTAAGQLFTSFSETISPAPTEGKYVTLTATDSNGNTSEFSACVQAVAAGNTFVVDSLGNSGDAVPGNGECATLGGDCTLAAAIDEVNALPAGSTPKRVEFSVGGIIRPNPALDPITKPVVINAIIANDDAACPTGYNAGNLLVRLDGNNIAGSSGHGLEFATGSAGSRVRGLSITRFPKDGIHIATNDITATCNFIGIGFNGTPNANGNDGNGITIDGDNSLIGGAGASARNVISDNAGHGVAIAGFGQANTVAGNIIGFDATGMVDAGNGLVGVAVDGFENLIGGSAEGEGNLIGKHSIGIYVHGTGREDNTISGNWLGVRADGMAHDDAASGTLIYITSGANNNTVGGNNAADGNLLGRPSFTGAVWIDGANGNKIRNNRIGVNDDGSDANGKGYGVWLTDADNNAINANTIAYMQFDGVNVDLDSTGNAIRVNSIYDNGGLGIDLGPIDGVSGYDGAGDTDTGANGLQNWPGILTAYTSGRILGLFQSASGKTYRFDIYESDSCDPSDYGEGQRHLGRYDLAVPSGSANFDFVVDTPPALDKYVTMTATDPDGNTSEFSQCVQARDVTYLVNSTGHDDVCGFSGTCTLRGAVNAANEHPAGPINILFDLSGTIDLGVVPLPPLVNETHIDAVTGQAGASCIDNLLVTVENGFDEDDLLHFDAGSSGSSVRGLRFSSITGHAIYGDYGVDALTITCNELDMQTGILWIPIQDGILLRGDDNVIGTLAEPNYVSTDKSGIVLLGDRNIVTGNILDANDLDGLRIEGFGNRVYTNTVSSNRENGIVLTDGARKTLLTGNAVTDNLFVGVTVAAGATESRVLTNTIGSNGDEGLIVDALITTIAGNTIESNGLIGAEHGVVLNSADFSTITDNIIANNGGAGIRNESSDQLEIRHNEISGNAKTGLSLVDAIANSVALNNIGIVPTRGGSSGNGIHGVHIIGTTTQTYLGLNTIAGNVRNGIRADATTVNNEFQQNRIYDNGSIGINLVDASDPGNGVTVNDANDSDVGANMLQNYAVITDADVSTREITFDLDTNSGSYQVEFYRDDVCHSSGYGQGRILLGVETVTAGSGLSDTVSNFDAGGYLTTIVTDLASGNSSEFSPCYQIDVPTAVHLGQQGIGDGNNGLIVWLILASLACLCRLSYWLPKRLALVS